MIDQRTVERILDTADIVDVVSDFVALKKRGANWVGLCPFHNDRNPSFYVSRAKGFCKCFSCGEGGSPVNFVMKHENISYVEALRYLAKKYNIEIEERELTDEERAQITEKESMYVINEFAMNFFEESLYNTQEGVDIGLSYFRERGFSDEIIKNFRLGYSPNEKSALHDAAVKAGYNEEMLQKVGLCSCDEHGNWFDKFRDRVIFPIFNSSGKVVAFGGRTLHNHHAKYLNSPESPVFQKRKTIYGITQAKREINKLDKCYIVEGYADVISMHQAGFRNVVAPLGTALTPEQIHSIQLLTKNATELFDGDEAGIRAAMKAVDLLLKQDMNIKVLVLPEKEDPDSFAQSHSATEITNYIAEHEQDFIDFKSNILLKDCESDPIQKSKAIEAVMRSVACIPNVITRNIYAQECVRKFQLSEEVINTQINRYRAQMLDEEKKFNEREARREAANTQTATSQTNYSTPVATEARVAAPIAIKQENTLHKSELEVIRYVMKYGCALVDNESNFTVIDWVKKEIDDDDLHFTHPLYKQIYDQCLLMSVHFEQSFAEFMASIEAKKAERYGQEIEQIRNHMEGNLQEINRKEQEAAEKVDAEMQHLISEFRLNYIAKQLISDPNDQVRQLANDICLPKHTLSKIHIEISGGNHEMDDKKLMMQVSAAIFNWKYVIIELYITDLKTELKDASIERQLTILKEINELNVYKLTLAKLIGERVITPSPSQ
ncbi:MAG: DNA primase [Sodaliphilus sp.]